MNRLEVIRAWTGDFVITLNLCPFAQIPSIPIANQMLLRCMGQERVQ